MAHLDAVKMIALDYGESAVADSGYVGEPHHIRTPQVGTEDEQAMQDKARARHETVNKRLKDFEMVGQNDFIESDLVIHLPPGNEYHQTDESVSGHPFINSITISDEEFQDERQRGRRAMVVWLIDLTKKSKDKSIKYSQRDVAIMDDSSDDNDLYG